MEVTQSVREELKHYSLGDKIRLIHINPSGQGNSYADGFLTEFNRNYLRISNHLINEEVPKEKTFSRLFKLDEIIEVFQLQ